MARTKFDDQLSRFIQRGRRRRNPATNSYKPAKQGTPSARLVKRSAKGY